MATSLDQQIEQLGKIVEARLGLCKEARDGVRCTLPANHDDTEPHQFALVLFAHRKAASERLD